MHGQTHGNTEGSSPDDRTYSGPFSPSIPSFFAPSVLFLFPFLLASLIGCRSNGTDAPTTFGRDRYRQWQQETKQNIPVVRVQLNELYGTSSVTLTSNRKTRVELLGPSNAGRTFDPWSDITFRRHGQKVIVNGRSFHRPSGFRVITGSEGYLSTGQRQYRGNMRVYPNTRRTGNRKNEGLMVVNYVPINQYLWSVLGGELLPSWTGRAINRTQAVAARTYALLEVKRRLEEPDHQRFDLYNTQQSQVYKGIGSERPSTKRAVQNTLGEVLFYNQDRLVPTFFSSTCGGHTSRPRSDFSWLEGPAPPPLKGVPCPWDSVSRHHRWKAILPPGVMARALFPGKHNLRVIDMMVVSRRPDQRVRELAFRLSNGRIKKLPGHTFRRKIAQHRPRVRSERKKEKWWIRSTKFRAKKLTSGSFYFRGRGLGHGVGLCQYGAYGASQEGHTYIEILEHYYPSAFLDTLYPSRQ